MGQTNDNRSIRISSLKKDDKDRFLLTYFRRNAREKFTKISKHGNFRHLKAGAIPSFQTRHWIHIG